MDQSMNKADYDSLPCPLCGRVRNPLRVNKDGSVSYSCPPHRSVTVSAGTMNHYDRYSWRITKDGDLAD